MTPLQRNLSYARLYTHFPRKFQFRFHRLQYKYLYPYEVNLLLPIEGANDFYNLIGGQITNECFDDPNDLVTFMRDDLSG